MPENKYHLPDDQSAKSLLGMFCGKSVKVNNDAPWKPENDYFVAHYINDQKELVILGIIDIALAANLSSTLTRIPEDTVKEAIKTKTLTDSLQDNLREIMNICASLLNSNTTEHIVFTTTIEFIKTSPSEAVNSILSNPSTRIDFKVELPNGTIGNISFIAR